MRAVKVGTRTRRVFHNMMVESTMTRKKTPWTEGRPKMTALSTKMMISTHQRKTKKMTRSSNWTQTVKKTILKENLIKKQE